MTFFGKSGRPRNVHLMLLASIVVFLGQNFLTSYCAHQTEIICQSYVPGKLMYQFTQTGPMVLALHLLGLDFWMFRVFHYFSIVNRPSILILTQFRSLQLPHLFSKICYQHPSYFISIMSVSIFLLFDINEMKHYFCCISIFMVISIFFFIPA